MSSVLRFDEWQDSEGNPVASGVGGAFTAPGTIVAVKDVLKTDTFTASVAAGDNVAVTDLSITHEVSDPANKLLISAFFGATAHSAGKGDTGLAVAEDGVFIGVGDAAGSRVRVGSNVRPPSTTVDAITSPSVTFVHTPGAGSKTYTVRAINLRPTTQTVYVNRTENDPDEVVSPRAVSSIVIQEVAV